MKQKWTIPTLATHQSHMRTVVEELFVTLRKSGQGLTLGQEDIVRHAFGYPRFVTSLPKEELVPGTEVWISEKLPIVYTLAHASPLAQDTEMLETPRIDHAITNSEEYKAMIVSRDKRIS